MSLGLAAGACSDPELRTDLRPAGPPDVLAVLAQHPIDLTEAAIYCRYVGTERDPKAPGFVGDPLTGGGVVCPPTSDEFEAAELEPRPFLTLNAAGQVVDNQPWALRVMFDELLDADRVETLVPVDPDDTGNCEDGTAICTGSLDDTQPFTLTCGAMDTEVAYTGHYTPNGNNTTFPLGPSLYLKPDPAALTFPTGTECTLAIDADVVTDKEGVSVTTEDQAFTVKIQDLMLLAVDPADGDDAVISPDPVAAGAAAFVFNASIERDPDFGSVLDPAMFQLLDGTGAEIPTWTFVGPYYSAGLQDAVYVFPDTSTGIFLPGEYTAIMKPGTLTETNGGELEVTSDVKTEFSVAFGKTGQTSGTSLGVISNIRISFNNTIDPASVDTAVGGADLEFFATTSTTPNMSIPAAIAIGNGSASGNANGVPLNNIDNNSIIIDPTSELALGTYVVRIKAGAEVTDVDANTARFAAPVAITYNVLLTALGATTPPSGGTLPAANDFSIIFSGSLARASATEADFEIIDLSNMMPVPYTLDFATRTPPAGVSMHPDDIVVLNPTANLTPGRMYRVSLKAGAVLTNVPVAGFNPVTRTFTSAVNWVFTAT